MQIIKETSPYIRKDVSAKRMMIDVFIALIPATIFSMYKFGGQAVSRIIVSIIVMILFEAIGFLLMTKGKKKVPFFKRQLEKFSQYRPLHVIVPALSGLIYALILPSALPMYGVIVGAIFGIVVAKMLFGGTGNNIFNVAAAGRIFVGLALTGQFTSAYTQTDVIAGATALSTFRDSLGFPNVLDSYTLWDLFLGNIPGSMGEVSVIAILIGAIYLIIRHSADYRLILGSIIPFSIFMFIAGFAMYETNALSFVLFQLFSGGFMFGAIFMITDPVTAPVNAPGRLVYALMFVFVTTLIRLFGAYPEGVAFAILFSNMFVSTIEYTKWSTNRITKKYIAAYSIVFVLLALIIFIGSGGFI